MPAGKVYFLPDGSKGNSGQAGFAEIKDGKFNTASSGGRGFSPGAVIVAIEGMDPTAPPDKPKKGEEGEPPSVKVLFTRYETIADFAASASKDFVVPDSAAKGPVAPTPKPGTIIP